MLLGQGCTVLQQLSKGFACSLPEDQPEAPATLLGSEQYELYNCSNMDDFFLRLYRYLVKLCSI